MTAAQAPADIVLSPPRAPRHREQLEFEGIGDGGLSARHSAENANFHSPSYIVEAAREVLGRIDLDPASCERANAVIKASTFFDVAQNGYQREWGYPYAPSTTFLNPPGGRCDKFGRPIVGLGANACTHTGACGLPVGHVHEGGQSSQKAWWFKLTREYVAGNVSAAIFVCFSVELLQTTQTKTPAGLPTPLRFPICYPSKRVAYIDADGNVAGSPPHSSCIVYLPPMGPGWEDAVVRFEAIFSPLGEVVVPRSKK